jgi:hypothetical protein
MGGSGTGVPKNSEFVSLPGAYSDDDSGILVPNVRLQASLRRSISLLTIISFSGL